MSNVYALLELALRRYPMMSPPLALMCFCSDRKAAGLGALAEEKRNAKSEVRNVKYRDWTRARSVFYRMTIDRPPRTVWPDREPATYITAEATDCITFKRLPAVNKCVMVSVEMDEFFDQNSRGGVARKLRKARQELRSQGETT